jgi:N,N-dimethylformamidase
MTTKRIYGYADPLMVKAGEALSFMVSGEGMEAVDAQLVKLIHGDENPDGPGFVEEEVASDIPATLAVSRQFTQVGSHAVVHDPEQRLAAAGDFTLYAFIYPTKPGVARQAILAKWDIMAGKGYGLGIAPDGRLEFWVGDGHSIDQVSAEIALMPKAWYFVAASFNATTREVHLYQIGAVNRYNSLRGPVVPADYDSRVIETLRVAPAAPGAKTAVSSPSPTTARSIRPASSAPSLRPRRSKSWHNPVRRRPWPRPSPIGIRRRAIRTPGSATGSSISDRMGCMPKASIGRSAA